MEVGNARKVVKMMSKSLYLKALGFVVRTLRSWAEHCKRFWCDAPKSSLQPLDGHFKCRPRRLRVPRVAPIDAGAAMHRLRAKAAVEVGGPLVRVHRQSEPRRQLPLQPADEVGERGLPQAEPEDEVSVYGPDLHLCHGRQPGAVLGAANVGPVLPEL